MSSAALEALQARHCWLQVWLETRGQLSTHCQLAEARRSLASPRRLKVVQVLHQACMQPAEARRPLCSGSSLFGQAAAAATMLLCGKMSISRDSR